MGAVAEDGHEGAVEADDEQGSRVPWRAERSHGRHHRRRKPRRGRYADRGREEFLVHVVSMGRAGWNHRRRYSVDCVARRHDAGVQYRLVVLKDI
jgi:hypothetical protein